MGVQIEYQFFRLGGVALGLGDIAVFQHLIQHQITAPDVVIRITHRIVGVGGVNNSYQRSTFGQRQLRNVFAEEIVGRRLDTAAIVGEIHDVEVHLQNLFFTLVLIQIDRAENLLNLTLDAHLIVAGQVLDQLLSNGRRTSYILKSEEEVENRLARTENIHAVVLVESVILDSDQRFAEVRILFQLGVRHPQTVLGGIDTLILQLHGSTRPVLPVLRRFVIHIIDTSRRIGIGLEKQGGIYGGIDIVFHIDREYRSDDYARNQTDQHDGQKNIQHVGQQPQKHFTNNSNGFHGFPAPRHLTRSRSPTLVSCHSLHQPFRQWLDAQRWSIVPPDR